MKVDVEEGPYGLWGVVVDGNMIASSNYKSLCIHMAKTIAKARDTSHRSAIQILVHELGLSEEDAQDFYMSLHNPTGAVN